jgi:hypothetical protein
MTSVWTLPGMRDNMTNRRAVLRTRQCKQLRRRLFRAMIHKTRSPGLIHVCLLFSVGLTLGVPASAEWKEKVLHSFQGGANDGSDPAGGVVFDAHGNLYGATTGGGSASCGPIAGECGTVFQVTPPAQKGGSWTETLIYQFQGKGSNDASVPTSGLIRDATGNLYGVTGYGGTGDCVLTGVLAGCGTVYELSPPKQKGGVWTETLLYSFPTAKQGYLPNGSLVFDSAGNLYGATVFGGDRGSTCNIFYGGQCGTVFKLSPPKSKGGKWTEKVLHSFAGISNGQQTGDGANPNGGLVLDSKGKLYGTTFIGGYNCPQFQGVGCGTVFELKAPKKAGGAWTEKILHRFTDGNDGAGPNGGLIFDAKGSLYGTGGAGGTQDSGVVFRFTQTSGRWIETVLYSFRGTKDESDPKGLVFDSLGNLYCPSGSIVRLKPPKRGEGSWTLSVLYEFQGPPDGSSPLALIFGAGGALYGTTLYGGTGQSCQGGCGTIFEAFP